MKPNKPYVLGLTGGIACGKSYVARLLRQRGIPEAEARLLLQHAFVNEVLSRIEPEPLRDRLSYLVEMRFRHRLKQCGSCTLCKPNKQ